MDAKTMGKFIAKMWKEKGMTQASLAQVLHVTSQAISKWERGIGFPDISTLQPLSVSVEPFLCCILLYHFTPLIFFFIP